MSPEEHHPTFQSQSLLEIPLDVSPEHRQRLQHLDNGEGPRSLQAKFSFYELMIETYHDPKVQPYLIVRLALLAHRMGSRCIALNLCREAQSLLLSAGVEDPGLDLYIEKLNAMVEEGIQRALEQARQRFYYQTWKDTRSHRFPTALPFAPPEADEIRTRWQDLAPPDSEFRAAYLRKLAIETNHVESVFSLTDESVRDIVRRGIADGVVEWTEHSCVQDVSQIRAILEDTFAAYEMLTPFIAEPAHLNKQAICDVHRRLMQTAGYLESSYIPPGRTRTETRKTVLLSGAYSIEFCPFEEVDAEVEYICRMAKQWIKSWRNPFATSSWMHLILGRCHPFDDGNGRISRLFSSLPLLRYGYPPISISTAQRPDYYTASNKTYEGEHTYFVQFIVDGMKENLDTVQAILMEKKPPLEGGGGEEVVLTMVEKPGTGLVANGGVSEKEKVDGEVDGKKEEMVKPMG
ncbi:hypothetical protein CC2G_003573 [Coprinopsis cinerea AmutBmut pab1-1]|nr:hypothetical protein CC2G_003573 [Coprinopsis cinerea AmutBmut pab1-1]